MVAFQRIETINIAVRDAAESAERFRELGLAPVGEDIIDLHEPPAQIRYHQIRIGESSLSLVEPTDDSSPIARFLSKRGEGMFSVNVVVDDLRALMQEWSQKGIQWVLEEPLAFEPQGARRHAGLVNWVRPDQLNGVLLEFTERHEHG